MLSGYRYLVPGNMYSQYQVICNARSKSPMYETRKLSRDQIAFAPSALQSGLVAKTELVEIVNPSSQVSYEELTSLDHCMRVPSNFRTSGGLMCK